MSYFKTHRAQPIKRPLVYKVTLAQLGITFAVALITTWFAPNLAFSMLLGGLIGLAGQFFFNVRALRHFGSVESALVVTSTFSAMWGKWLIIIATSVIAVMKFEELYAGALFLSLFIVHTMGALLLPVLVKREA